MPGYHYEVNITDDHLSVWHVEHHTPPYGFSKTTLYQREDITGRDEADDFLADWFSKFTHTPWQRVEDGWHTTLEETR